MIRAKITIFHDDKSYKKGELINGLSEKEKKRLVDLNAAEYIISPEEELRVQQVSEPIVISPELFEELRMALDAEYNAEELAREAKAVGVELKGIKGKPATIEAIINQGKADQLLEDEDENE